MGILFRALLPRLALVSAVLSLGVSLAAASPCSSLIGSCDYYLCREAFQPCGGDGYASAFGYEYCSRSAGDEDFGSDSPQLRDWAVKTARCLEEKVDAIPETVSCEELMSSAIASHTECYVKGGFCELSFGDKLEIFTLVGSEITNPEILKEMLEVAGRCGKGML